MTLRVLSLSHQAAAAYKGKGRSQPTCRARGCRDRLGIPKPPPPGGGHAPRGAPSTRAARLLGRTHRPRLPGARCPRATLCQRPPCVRRAAHHRAKRRVGVWCSLPMLGPCAQRQRYATACCAYRPTFIRCLSINPPPPPPPPPPPVGPTGYPCWRQMSTPRGPAPPGASPLVSPRCALVEDDSTLLPQYRSQEG